VNKQFSVGGKWNQGPFSLSADFNYSWASENLYYTELDADQQVGTFTQNTGTSIPAVTLTGANLANEAGYSVGGLTDSINHYSGDEKAARIDGEYKTSVPVITAIDLGFRWAETEEMFNPIRYFDSLYNATGAGNRPITNYSNLYEQAPYVNSLFGRTDADVAELRNFYVANPSALKSIGPVLSELGLSGGPVTSPLSLFNIDENTYAGYAMAKYSFTAGVPIDGNFGVRAVTTIDHLVGNQTNLSGTGYVPINQNNSYGNLLPSLNARAKLLDNLYLRAGLYKSLTRPDFSSLSPSLTLLPANLVGNSGNPELKPLHANNADLSLEWYFSRTGSLTGAAFYKKVTGFPLTIGTQQLVGDQTYVISEPQNSGSGEIKGAEVGYQQFFDFLPGPLSGLGAQANFTYVDSAVPSSVVGFSSQLPNLSRYQYNLVGIYEKGPWSARAAYNWRSSYVSAIYVGPVGVGVLPEDTKAFGWLDAAVNYTLNKHLTFSLEGSNLLQTKRQGYYSNTLLPWFSEIDDRQILVGAHFHW
jgi:iron complex outermembrane recepter protein